jgi:hypothetical protein
MSHCGLRSEEEDFRTLRNRMLECICEEAMKQKKDPQWFHGIEMVEECARGFFEQKTADKYQYSDEDKHELRRDTWTDTTTCNKWEHTQSG